MKQKNREYDDDDATGEWWETEEGIEAMKEQERKKWQQATRKPIDIGIEFDLNEEEDE